MVTNFQLIAWLNLYKYDIYLYIYDIKQTQKK